MKRTIFFLFTLVFFSNCQSTQNNEPNTMSTNNLKELHSQDKAVSTNVAFTTQQGKVISLQILKNQQLKEHITDVPAFLVCVSGQAVYGDEKGKKITLKNGDYVNIEPNVKHWVDAIETSNLLLIK